MKKLFFCFRRRKSVFEVDRSLCSRPSLEALLLSLMRAREMLLFALWNDGVDRENRWQKKDVSNSKKTLLFFQKM